MQVPCVSVVKEESAQKMQAVGESGLRWSVVLRGLVVDIADAIGSGVSSVRSETVRELDERRIIDNLVVSVGIAVAHLGVVVAYVVFNAW